MISTIIDFLVTSPFIINLLLIFLIILDVVLSVLALLAKHLVQAIPRPTVY